MSKLKEKVSDIEKKWHECPFDGFKAKSREFLEYHISRCHDIHDVDNYLKKNQSKVKGNGEVRLYKWHECSQCDYKAKKKSMLEIHLAQKHSIGDKWYECPYDDYKTKVKDSIAQHIINKHAESYNMSECPYCGCQSAHIHSHISINHKKEIKVLWTSYKCTFCSFKTKNYKELVDHITKHLENNETKRV